MTDVNKLVNPQHSGNDPADIWIGIRLNLEIRIRIGIADHFHLSLDILAEVCAVCIQSGCYTIISRMWKSLACLTRITGFRANYYLCSWYSVCKPDNVRVVQRLFGQVPDYITSLLTPVTNIPSRSSLRASSNGDLIQPRTDRQIGDRAFSVAAPHAWNRRPTELKLMPSQVKSSSL